MSLTKQIRFLKSTTILATRLNLLKSHLHPTIRTMATGIPKTMCGVLIEKTGGSEVLQYKTDLPVPTLSAGEVLIKNSFIGINYIDTYFRTGLYPSPKPEILGREAEGTVADVADSGNLYNIKKGDYVVWMGMSAYAEYSVCKADKVHVVPEAMRKRPGEAAAALLQGLTALTLIREAYAVQKGDWVLVHAAAGGVGLWLCQLLKATGARVIGTASTPEKRDLAKENGAEVVVDYADLGPTVQEKTGGAGVAAVFDSVGKSTFDSSLDAVARKGTLVSFGNASGAVPPLTIARLSAKNVKILRPTLFGYIYTREEYEKYAAELFNFIIKDKLNVRIHEVYPLKDVKRAHDDIEGRKTTGKLLLKL